MHFYILILGAVESVPIHMLVSSFRSIWVDGGLTRIRTWDQPVMSR